MNKIELLERYNRNVFAELDCSIMDQSHQINNVSVISASFRGEGRKSEAQPCQVASPDNNPCQISFGVQDPI